MSLRPYGSTTSLATTVIWLPETIWRTPITKSGHTICSAHSHQNLERTHPAPSIPRNFPGHGPCWSAAANPGEFGRTRGVTTEVEGMRRSKIPKIEHITGFATFQVPRGYFVEIRQENKTPPTTAKKWRSISRNCGRPVGKPTSSHGNLAP